MDSLPDDLKILAIDVGGTGIKASLLDNQGQMLCERVRVKTPHPLTTDLLVDTIVTLVASLTGYSRISVGFPGVVRQGKIITAPNLGTDILKGFDLAAALGSRLGHPVKLSNDADMQGLAVIQGKGMEMVITLGTGMGSAIFAEGHIGPHLELSHHPFRKEEDYDLQLGNAALEKIGAKKWNKRVAKAIANFRILTNFDHLYIGGGNAKEITFTLPPDITIVTNENGIKGGAWLWREAGPKD